MDEPIDILRRGVEAGRHPGAQLFVALNGRTVVDFACGEARIGAPMTRDSITQWYSSGKPLMAVLLAMLQERGLLEIEGRVTAVIPEFGAGDKEAVTFWHLLTHTAGFRSADNIDRRTPWDEMIRLICATPLEPGWAPGEKAGYSTAASWHILAEAVQRVTGRPCDEYMKTELFGPLGMRDSWLRLPFANLRAYGARVAVMYNTEGPSPEPLPLQDVEGMATCRPGASARGPARELASFYGMLLNGGAWEGRTFLKAETAAWLVQRHRAGMYDQTFMHTLDFGLGFILDSNRHGAGTVPYGYGVHASEQAFGHSGAQSSCAFADLRHGLTVAWVANGQPGEREHQRRQRALNSAIYEAAGLNTGAPFSP